MATTATALNTTRQTVLVAERAFNYLDFTSGTAKVAIYMRPGARVLRGFVDITTAWNSGTSDALVVGDTEGASPVTNRYKTSFSIHATGLTALVAPVADGMLETAEAITLTWTGVGAAPTAGAGVLHVEYIEDQRSTELNVFRG